jgi:hypothetical protein
MIAVGRAGQGAARSAVYSGTGTANASVSFDLGAGAVAGQR